MVNQGIILPPLAKDDYERLKASIAQDGQQIPILVNSNTGEAIDGAYRLRVCEELGIEPLIESRPLEPDVAERLKIALNTARRHLTPEQKRALAIELKRAGFSQEAVASVIGVSQPRISQITSDISPNNICIPDLRLKLLVNDKEEIRERAEGGESQKQIAADFGISQQRVSQILSGPAPIETPPWPEKGKYRCIVIDPPWPMKKIKREVRPKQTEHLDYPIMKVDEIADLPIADLADKNGCHLYLWVTHKFLPLGLELFKRWGVKYECLMTWVKNVGMTPYSWMYSTEHVLFGRTGSLDLDRKGLRLDFAADVRGHSIKPDEFYQRVIWASPPPRLDMFARRERDGFEAWGAEVAPMGNRQG